MGDAHSSSGERTRHRVHVSAPSPKHFKAAKSDARHIKQAASVALIRDREGAIACTRGACAPQRIFRVATPADWVFHPLNETFFDLTRFRCVARYGVTRRNEF